MSEPIAIRARNVTVRYEVAEFKTTSLKELVMSRLQRRKNASRWFNAVDDVSFDVRRGESVAIIGHNGSGKSTLLKVVAGVIKPVAASVETFGRIAPMIELGAGFDPELSGLENIRLACLLMGLNAREVEAKQADIVRFSELGRFINMPVKNFSSGMYARLGFACTTAVDPEILIIDEVLAVGDTNFARKCLHRIEQLRAKGVSVVIVSHDENVIRSFCDRALLLDEGKLIHDGGLDEAFDRYREVMDRRHLASLPDKEREEVLRQRRLQKEFDDQMAGRSRDARPSISVRPVVKQDGVTVETLDVAKPFTFEFEIVMKDAQKLRGAPFFGIELRILNSIRIGGCGSEPHVLVSPADIEENPVFLVSFPFPRGLPELCATGLQLTFAVHDDDMRRAVFIDTIASFPAVNSAIGTNPNRDLLPFRHYGALPTYHPMRIE